MRLSTEQHVHQVDDPSKSHRSGGMALRASDESGLSSERMPSELIAAMAMIKRACGSISDPPGQPQTCWETSTNRLMDNAVHVASSVGVAHNLLPAMTSLRNTLAGKADECRSKGQASAAQAFIGHVNRVDQARDDLAKALPAAHGLKVSAAVAATLAEALSLPLISCPESTAARTSSDALLQLHSTLKGVALALMNASTDMAHGADANGRLTPECDALTMVCCQVIGNELSLTVGAATGHLEGRNFMPLVAHNLLQSIRLLTDATTVFTDYCTFNSTLNPEPMSRGLANSLISVTSRGPQL